MTILFVLAISFAEKIIYHLEFLEEMKNFILSILAFSLTISFTNCDNTAELKKLEKEMMDVHDEVMPIWPQLPTIATELKNIIGHPEVPTTRRPDIVDMVDRLEQAHDGMRDWMINVKTLAGLEGKSEEEIKNYFKSEKGKITQISKDMKNSLEDGNELLNEIKPKGNAE